MAGKPAGAGVTASVEAPLWQALTGYRVLTGAYALALFALAYDDYGRPLVGAAYLGVLAAWTAATLRSVSEARRCTPAFLAGDLAVAVAGILISPLADPGDQVGPTLPSVWVAGPVLAVALKSGWRWAAGASAVVGAANVAEAGRPSGSTLHNALLVCVAAIAIGYVVELARASERALARALRIEAATRERERLARDIHDSVLQVLAMVQRRGTVLGGEAAELGRLAGEQERALRALVAQGPEREPAERTGADGAAEPGELDLGELLSRLAAGTGGQGAAGAGDAGDAPQVSYAGPAGPVVLPARAARQVTAAVAAALDNVRRHAAGPDGPARAWILLEEEPDEVLVTVRDDGPGIPEGRLAEAEAEGRLGAALSIRGRMTELGGEAEWVSVPGQGTEVELRLPLPVKAGTTGATDG